MTRISTGGSGKLGRWHPGALAGQAKDCRTARLLSTGLIKLGSVTCPFESRTYSWPAKETLWALLPKRAKKMVGTVLSLTRVTLTRQTRLLRKKLLFFFCEAKQSGRLVSRICHRNMLDKAQRGWNPDTERRAALLFLTFSRCDTRHLRVSLLPKNTGRHLPVPQGFVSRQFLQSAKTGWTNRVIVPEWP